MANLVNPTALVAWAHRDPEWTQEEADSWRDEIAAFVTKLRGFGVDAEVDLHHVSQRGIDWTRFGPKAIMDRDWVIVALSPPWRDRWEGLNAPTIGAGAVAEADALRSLFAEDQQALREKLVLVTLPSMVTKPRLVPTGLHGIQHRRLSGFELTDMADLLRLLTHQDAYPATPLGEIPDLPPAVPGPIGGVNDLTEPGVDVRGEGPGIAPSPPRSYTATAITRSSKLCVLDVRLAHERHLVTYRMKFWSSHSIELDGTVVARHLLMATARSQLTLSDGKDKVPAVLEVKLRKSGTIGRVALFLSGALVYDG